ncbi:unnamed protein product [Brugia timori]|uniref:Uncharacterized protein n=1 Tax=Brugia timori TaxID=42155 RepID=A0A3P7XHP1_9BILA|nr:unnamed protein product [Brugia timori]
MILPDVGVSNRCFLSFFPSFHTFFSPFFLHLANCWLLIASLLNGLNISSFMLLWFIQLVRFKSLSKYNIIVTVKDRFC